MSDKKMTDYERRLAESVGLDIQPDPVPNDLPSAHDLVSRDIVERGYVARIDTSNMRGVYNTLLSVYISLYGGMNASLEEMGRRREFGLQKYGTLLQPFNDREHLEDAKDELADMLVYMRAHIFEEENPDAATH